MRLGTCALASVAFLLSGPAAVAQDDPPVKLDPVVMAAADALGMVRGPDRRVDLLNTVQFRATGVAAFPSPNAPSPNAPTGNGRVRTMKFDKVVVGESYYTVAAGRFDFQASDAAGKPGLRIIRVVAGNKAWDETTAGVGKAWSTDVARRLADVWLSPHGALRAATLARVGEVKVAKAGGKDVISTPAGALSLTITLGIDHRPETVATIVGGHKVVASYTGYKDWDGYDVAFPSHILQTVDGKVVLDLMTTEFRSNPYVVFPVPVELAAH